MSDIALQKNEEMAVLAHDIQIEYAVSEDIAYKMAEGMVFKNMTINEAYGRYVWGIC